MYNHVSLFRKILALKIILTVRINLLSTSSLMFGMHYCYSVHVVLEFIGLNRKCTCIF